MRKTCYSRDCPPVPAVSCSGRPGPRTSARSTSGLGMTLTLSLGSFHWSHWRGGTRPRSLISARGTRSVSPTSWPESHSWREPSQRCPGRSEPRTTPRTCCRKESEPEQTDIINNAFLCHDMEYCSLFNLHCPCLNWMTQKQSMWTTDPSAYKSLCRIVIVIQWGLVWI